MSWAVLAAGANGVISAAYFGIAGAVAVPLLRSGQLRRNRLGAATAAIFFSCAVGHGLHMLHVLDGGTLGSEDLAHTALWDSTTAMIAVYYWTLRRTYAPLMRGANLFEDMREQQRVERLEAAQAVATARQEAERERDAQAALLRAVIDNAQPLIYVKDLEGRYILANEAFRRSFGLSEVELIGRTDAEVAPDSAGRRREHDELAAYGPFRVEEEAETVHGPRIFDSARFPVVDPDGTVRGTGGVSLDVTAAHEASAELAAARDEALAATAAKSTFLATMSHEIRTPMNAVIGLTALLLDTPLTTDQRDLVETARASGDALLDLINDILDFSKIEAGELRIESCPFDVVDLIDGVTDLVARTAAQKGLSLTTWVRTTCPQQVEGDPTRLRQVVLNLLSNAIKFTAEGEVALRVWGTGGDAEQARLWVAIEDSGIGISPEAARGLFAAFSQLDASTTRKYGGTGLGLAISRRLVEAMGGTIDVRSEPGVGSCFTFSVCVRPISTAPAWPDPALRDRNVLLIQESEPTARAIAAQLAEWGVRCEHTDEPGAVEYEHGGWHAVLVGDASGWDDIRAALAGVPDVPVVALGSAEAWQRNDRVRFVDVIHRPVKLRTLHDALVRAVTGADAVVPVVPAQRTESPLSPMRILLAEDNAVNQKVGRLLLRNLGYSDVDVVSDGAAAVQAVRARDYDLVLMDVQMPGTDGLDATRLIREFVPAGVPPQIIALTAAATASDREACVAAGMDGYLSKPIREEALRALLAGVPAAEFTDPGAAAAVDVKALQTLLDKLGYTDVATTGLIDQFLSSAGNTVEALGAAAADGDRTEVARLAHDLRSTAALFGAARLAQLLGDLESAARSGEPDLALLSKDVSVEWAETQAALCAWADKATVAPASADDRS